MTGRDIQSKTVDGKLRRWYPLPHQRQDCTVKRLKEHMLRCRTCCDPREDLCREGYRLLDKADLALGLRGE